MKHEIFLFNFQDNFNVMNIKSPDNYYLNYSIQGLKHSRSYLHQIAVGSEKYSFIGVDACLEPGPKRPFNFIGYFSNDHIHKIKKLVNETKQFKSDHTVWFGHYPTSSILSEYKKGIREIIGKLLIYCIALLIYSKINIYII